MKRMSMSKFIFGFIFGIRPIIDLFWNKDIISGINLAACTAGMMIVLSFEELIRKKRLFINPMICSGILIILHTGVMTLLFANNIWDYNYIIRLTSGMVILIVAIPMFNQKEFEKCLFVFILATTIPILFTFLQNAGMVQFTYFDYVGGHRISRGSGGYHQPSVLTRFCIFGLLYTLYFLDSKWKSNRQKIFAYIYILLNISAIFLSYHRTGYLLAVCIPGLWFFLKYRDCPGRFFITVFIISTAGVLLFFGLYSFGVFSIDLSIFQKLLSLRNIARFENGHFRLAMRGRDVFVIALFNSYAKHPWYNIIFGNGAETNLISGITMNVADLEIVRILWNCGIVGGILWLIHLISVRYCLKSVKRLLEYNSLYRLGVCIFVSYLVWGLTLETSATPNILYHFYFVCGFVYYSGKEKRNELYSKVSKERL